MGLFESHDDAQDVRIALEYADTVDGGETKAIILEVEFPKTYLSVYQLEQLIGHLSHILDRAKAMPETSAEAEKEMAGKEPDYERGHHAGARGRGVMKDCYEPTLDPPCPFEVGDWVECMGGVRIKGRVEMLDWAAHIMALEGSAGFFNPRLFQKMDDPPAVSAKKPHTDPVYSPPHYTSHPSGVEAITITEHMSFNVGNAMKYLFRHGLKGDAVEDLKKSRWYIDREIKRLEGMKK